MFHTKWIQALYKQFWSHLLYVTDDDIDLEPLSEGQDDSDESTEGESNLDPNGYEIDSSSEGEIKRIRRDSEDEEVSLRVCDIVTFLFTGWALQILL